MRERELDITKSKHINLLGTKADTGRDGINAALVLVSAALKDIDGGGGNGRYEARSSSGSSEGSRTMSYSSSSDDGGPGGAPNYAYPPVVGSREHAAGWLARSRYPHARAHTGAHGAA